MRGPVLRGGALLVEQSPFVDPDDPGRLRLRELRAGGHPRAHPGPLRVDFPFGRGGDHAEGVHVLTPDAEGERLVVVYDSPSPVRLGDDGTVLADIVRLPG